VRAVSSLEVASQFASGSSGIAQSKNLAMPFLLPRKQPRLCSSAEESTARRLKDAMRRNCPTPLENRNPFCGVENRKESWRRREHLQFAGQWHIRGLFVSIFVVLAPFGPPFLVKLGHLAT